MSVLRRFVFTLSIVVPAAAFAADAPAEKPYTPAQCGADLDDLDAFIRVNDAGAAAALADHGPVIAQALEQARRDAGGAADPRACGKLLHAYARAWRPGHIAVVPMADQDQGAAKAAGTAAAKPAADPAVDPFSPRFKALGKDTVLIVIPSFNDRHAPAMKQLVAAHRAELASHRNWIIDVRDNGGGSDVTYAPLMGWLLDGDLRGFGTEYFVTPANLAAQERICARTSDVGHCDKEMQPILAKMRTAAPGSFVLAGDKRIAVDPVKLESHRPARVALLTDHDCGSSCEQFVLEARTSYRVKVVGRPTYGSLDVSNLRPHVLPSGRVQLYYATTRTTRLPEMRIDTVGVAPDILLPKPLDAAGRDAEIGRVQRWLESGSAGSL